MATPVDLDEDPTADPGSAATDAFLKEFAKHQERIFAYVYALLPHRPDAEDVFQRTSLTLWRKFATWDRQSPFTAWAFGVAFYQVKNFIRSAGRDRLRFDDQLLDRLADERGTTVERRDARLAALGECLKTLDDSERALVDGAYRDEENIKELATRTGRAVQTLYNRLNLIRRKLLTCVDMRAAAERSAT